MEPDSDVVAMSCCVPYDSKKRGVSHPFKRNDVSSPTFSGRLLHPLSREVRTLVNKSATSLVRRAPAAPILRRLWDVTHSHMREKGSQHTTVFLESEGQVRSDFAKPAGHSYSSRRCVRSSGMDSRGFNNFGHCLVRLIDIAGALGAQGAMLRGCRVFPTPRDCFSPKSTTWRAHRFHLLSVACDKAYGMSSCNDDRPVLPLQRSAEHQ